MVTFGQRMKRVNEEQVNSVLTEYLKRRQYSDSVRLRTSGNQMLSFHEFAMDMASEEENGNGVITQRLGNAPALVLSVDEAFDRFSSFVAHSPDSLKNQLQPLLFPVFLHLLVQLFDNNHRLAAKKFYLKSCSLFADDVKYKTFMESIAQSFSSFSLETIIKVFSRKKVIVSVDNKTQHRLNLYLRTCNDLIVHQIINDHIEIEAEDAQEKDSLDHQKNLISESRLKGSLDDKEQHKNSFKSKVLSQLEQVVKNVREEPPSLPSICVCSVDNKRPSSVAVDSNLKTIAAGFESSVIELWSFTSGTEPTPVNGESQENNFVSSYSLKLDDLEGQIGEATDTEIGEDRSLPSSASYRCSLRGHSGPVYGLCFVPNSDLLLSCSEDTTVRGWNTKSCKPTAIYSGHMYPVWSLDASPLGSYFATASKDTSARLWNLDRAYPLRIFAGHTMDVDCVKFHPNCNYIATGSTDKTVRLWNVSTGTTVRVFQGHRGGIQSLCFSPDGKLLASAGEDRRVKVWDINSGSLLREYRGHSDSVLSLSFDRNQSVLASCGSDRMLKLWDLYSKSGVKSESTPKNVDSSSEFHASSESLATYSTKLFFLLTHFMPHNLLFAFGSKQP